MSPIILYLLIFLVVYFGGCRGVQFTNANFNGISAGTPFTLTFAGASGTVTLVLLNANFDIVSTIASGLTDTSFVWTPSTSLSQGEYNLKIEASDGESNLSSQFEISVSSVSSSASIQNTPTTDAPLPQSSSAPPASPTSPTSPVDLVESLPPTATEAFSPSPTTAVSTTTLISTAQASTFSSTPSSTPLVSSTASTSSTPVPSALALQLPESSISSISSTASSSFSTIPISTEQSSTIAVSPSSTALTSTQQPTASSTPSSAPTSHKGLSNGAEAGLIIGAMIAAMLLIGTISLFFFHYGKKVALKPSGLDRPWYALGRVEAGSGAPPASELGAEYLPEKQVEQRNMTEAIELEAVSPLELGGHTYIKKSELSLEAALHHRDRLSLHEMG